MRHKPHHLFLGMVALSAVFHAVVSVVSWPQNPTNSTGEDFPSVENEISIATQASPITLAELPAKSLPASPQVSPAPPKPTAQTSAPPLQSATATAAFPSEVANWQQPEPPLDQPLPISDESESAEYFQESLAAEQDSDTVVADDFSESTDSAVDSEPVEPEQVDTEQTSELEQGPEQGVVLQLADDFPHLSGSQSGCFGLSNCHQASGSYRQVVRQLTEQLRANGYRLTEDDTIDGVGHRVFEVVMPHDPESLYYLNVFSDGLDSAVYAITVNILSLDELKNLQA